MGKKQKLSLIEQVESDKLAKKSPFNQEGINSFIKDAVTSKGVEYNDNISKEILDKYGSDYDSMINDIGRSNNIPEENIESFRNDIYNRYGFQKPDDFEAYEMDFVKKPVIADPEGGFEKYKELEDELNIANTLISNIEASQPQLEQLKDTSIKVLKPGVYNEFLENQPTVQSDVIKSRPQNEYLEITDPRVLSLRQKANEINEALKAQHDYNLDKLDYGSERHKFIDEQEKLLVPKIDIAIKQAQENARNQSFNKQRYYVWNPEDEAKVKALKDIKQMYKGMNKLLGSPQSDDKKLEAFVYGLSNNFFTKDFATLGLSEVERLFNVKDAFETKNKLIEEGKSEEEIAEIMPSEQLALLDTYQMMLELQAGVDPNKFYAWGEGFKEMIPFIIQFAATGGIGATSKKAVEEFILKATQKRLFSKIGGYAAKSIAQGTSMLPAEFLKYAELTAPTINEQGELTEGMNPTKAALLAWGNTVLEVTGEDAGSITGKLTNKSSRKLLRNLIANDASKSQQLLAKMAVALSQETSIPSLQGVIFEGIGEEVTGLGQAILNDDYSFFSSDAQQQIWGMSLMASGGFAATSAPKRLAVRSKYNQSLKYLDDIPNGTYAEAVNNMVNTYSDIEDLPKAFMELNKEFSAQISNEDQAKAWNFIENTIKFNQMNVTRSIKFEQQIKQSIGQDGNVTITQYEGKPYSVRNPQDLGKEGKVIFLKSPEGEVKPVISSKLGQANTKTPQEVIDAQIAYENQVDDAFQQEQELLAQAAERGLIEGKTVETPDGDRTLVSINPDGTSIVVNDKGEQTIVNTDEIEPYKTDEQKDAEKIEEEANLAIMEGIAEGSEVIADEPLYDGSEVRVIDFDNGQSKIITPEGEQIVNSVEERDEIISELTQAELDAAETETTIDDLSPVEAFIETRKTDPEIANEVLSTDIESMRKQAEELRNRSKEVESRKERIDLLTQAKELETEAEKLDAILADPTVLEQQIQPEAVQEEENYPETVEAAPEVIEEEPIQQERTPDTIHAEYQQEKELAPYNQLLPWQKELLGRRVDRQSFIDAGDKNYITQGIARSWFAPKTDSGVSSNIDVLAQELSELGIEVTPDDIIDFIVENPTASVRRTTDEMAELQKEYKELTGKPISKHEVTPPVQEQLEDVPFRVAPAVVGITDKAREDLTYKTRIEPTLQALQNTYGIPVQIINSDEMPDYVKRAAAGKKITASGFYDPTTGTAYILSDIAKNKGIAEIKKTYMHEAVLHKGLDVLFEAGPVKILGKTFESKNELLDEVYARLDKETIADRAKYYAKDTPIDQFTKQQKRELAEEAMATLNETESPRLQVLIDKLYNFIKKLFGFTSKQFTKAEFRQLLRDHRDLIIKQKQDAETIRSDEGQVREPRVIEKDSYEEGSQNLQFYTETGTTPSYSKEIESKINSAFIPGVIERISANPQSLSDSWGFETFIKESFGETDIPTYITTWMSRFPIDNVGLIKSTPYGINTAIKLLSNLTSSKTFQEKGFDGLNSNAQHLVLSAVRASLHNNEIFRRVIKSIPINVMNNLIGEEVSTQDLLSDKSMLLDSLSVNPDDPVSLLVRSVVSEFLSLIPRDSIFKKIIHDGKDIEITPNKQLHIQQPEEAGTETGDKERVRFRTEEGKTFDEWKGDNKYVEDYQISDVKTGEPIVAKAYHGTTHEVYEFKGGEVGNIEGHLGKTNYFTSDYGDAESNYGAEGADLTGRIEQRKERIEQELEDEGYSIDDLESIKEAYNLTDEDLDRNIEDLSDIAYAISEKELKGAEEKVLELYVKLNNPLVLGRGPVYLDVIDEAEIESYLEDAALEIADEYDIDINEAKEDYSGEIRDRAVENSGAEDRVVEAMRLALEGNDIYDKSLYDLLPDYYGADGVDLNKIDKDLRSSEELMYLENEDGELINHQIISDFYEELGYDGVILTDVAERFPGMSLWDGVSHIHVPDQYNNQIKLADGSNVTFGDTSDIRFRQTEIDNVIETKDGLFELNEEQVNQRNEMIEKYGKERADQLIIDFIDANDLRKYNVSVSEPKFRVAESQQELDDFVKDSKVKETVYHGTGEMFDEFDPDKTMDGMFWFTSNIDDIKSGMSGAARRDIIMPVKLNIKNPAGWEQYEKLMIQQIIDQGYDGLILDDYYVAFSPDQILIEPKEEIRFMTDGNPNDKIREFGEELKKLGITDLKYSDSETNFGKSSYLYVGPFKIRVSDHSVTSPTRILNELHLSDFTKLPIIDEIERYYYPDRFKKVEKRIWGDEYYFPEDKLSTIQDEYRIIEGDNFISKRGRKMLKIQRKNKRSINYERLPDNETKFKVEEERDKVETNPSEAQIEAGNYKKGHVQFDGFDITIENPKGSIRKGTDEKGEDWSAIMPADYGYFKGTVGKDKDHIDVFMGDNIESDKVYVVDQVNPNTGQFDEHKVMIGYNSISEAKNSYLEAYEEGWQGLGAITRTTKEGLKEWFKGDTKKPFALIEQPKFQVSKDDINLFEKKLESKYKDLNLFLGGRGNKVVISQIILPDEIRGKGIGTKVMNDIINWADKNNITLSLTPSTDFGASSVSRLKSFYKKFGFIENKGKNKDFTISESMIRPKEYDIRFQVTSKDPKIQAMLDKLAKVQALSQEAAKLREMKEELKTVFPQMRQIIDDQILAFKAGVETGKEDTKELIKEVQKSIIDYAKKALPLTEAGSREIGPILTLVRNAQIPVDIEAAINRIDELAGVTSEKQERRKYIAKTNRLLKWMTGLRKSGTKRVGKFNYEDTKAFLKLKDIDKQVSNLTRVLNSNKAPEEEKVKAENDLETLWNKINEKTEKTSLDEAILKLIELRKLGSKASPELAKTVAEELESIYIEAKEAKSEADFEKAISIKDDKEFVKQFVRDEDLEGKPILKRAVVKLNNFTANTMGNWETLMTVLGGTKARDKFSLILNQVNEEMGIQESFNKVLDKAQKDYGLNSRNEVLKHIQKLKEENYELRKPNRAGEVGEGKPMRLTKMNLIDIYNAVKNDDIANSYYMAYGDIILAKDGTRDNEAQRKSGKQRIDALIDNLNAADKAFGDSMMEVVNGYKESTNTVFIKMFNRDMDFVENYWPSTAEFESDVDVMDKYFTEGKMPTSTQMRAQGRTPRPVDAFDKFNKHVKESEWYKNMALPLNYINKIFKDQNIQDLITEARGEGFLKTIQAHFKNLGLGSSTRDLTDVERIGGKILGNWVSAKIGLTPSVPFKQLTSMINYAENMPVGAWGLGFVKGLATPKQTFDWMWENVPYLQDRFKGGYSEALQYAMNAASGMPKATNTQQAIKNIATIGTRGGDIAAIIYGGKPYIDYLMKQGMSKEEAVNKFLLDTLRSQQAPFSSTLSTYQNSKNPFAKALFTFANTPSQYMRKMFEASQAYRHGDITAAQLGKIYAIYGVANQFLYVGAGALISALMKGSDPDEKLGANTVVQSLTSLVAGIPLVRDLVNTTLKRTIGLHVYDDALPVIGEVDQIGEAVINAIQGKNPEKNIKKAFILLMEMGGIPAGNAEKLWNATVKRSETVEKTVNYEVKDKLNELQDSKNNFEARMATDIKKSHSKAKSKATRLRKEGKTLQADQIDELIKESKFRLRDNDYTKLGVELRRFNSELESIY